LYACVMRRRCGKKQRRLRTNAREPRAQMTMNGRKKVRWRIEVSLPGAVRQGGAEQLSGAKCAARVRALKTQCCALSVPVAR